MHEYQVVKKIRKLKRQKLHGSYQTLLHQVLCIDKANGFKTRNLNFLFEQRNCKHAILTTGNVIPFIWEIPENCKREGSV